VADSPFVESMFAAFRESYCHYTSGVELTDEQMKAFKNQKKQLRIHTMVRAEVFLCTLPNTADFAVISNVKLKLILVDEAGEALESDV
jgi:coenzyme F420-reducing hydrogenase delta subunit